MAKTKTTTTKKKTTVTKEVVTKTTKKATREYKPAGVAYKTTTKNNTPMMIIKLANGTTLVIKKATTDKQLKYYQYGTTKNYTDKKDIYDIYNAAFVVDIVKEVK